MGERKDSLIVNTTVETADFDRTPEKHHLDLQILGLTGALVDDDFSMLHAIHAFLGVECDDKVIALGRDVIRVIVGHELELRGVFIALR